MLPLLLSLLFLFPIFSRECSSESLVPAVYVFGDSLLDAGNNNRHSLVAKANYRPYGINFPTGITGRFTNGKTFADIIAGDLGLPYPAAYRKIAKSLEGYTYASAGCGILNQTGSQLSCMHFDEQLDSFQKTIVEELSTVYTNPTDLAQYLANSIFIVWAGSNDYLLNYFGDNPNPGGYDPEDFAQLLIDRLSDKLKRLHGLGVRKFVVLGMGPLGCLPVHRKRGGHNETWCDEEKNAMGAMFNHRLEPMIKTLTTTYLDSYFTLGNTYNITEDAFKNPDKYGLTNVHSSCCLTGDALGNLPCNLILPWQYPCSNPEEYLFYDGAHPTEASFQILATPCFSGSGVCEPNNIQQLAHLPIKSPNLHSAA